jgi:hypothetical protein
MIPVEYLDSVKERLLTEPIVLRFDIRRERSTLTDGHMRVRVTLVDGGVLEFSEYVERTDEGGMQVTVYSYHWEDAEGNLVRRWDNTPHFPNLPGFPHHIHDGWTGIIASGRPMDIFVVLDYISQALSSQ